MQWISGREVRRTIALRLILVNATRGVYTALRVPADVSALANATPIGIPVTSRLASAFEAAGSISTYRVDSAGSSQTLVSTFVTVDLGISKVTRRTGALCVPVHNATLSVEPAHTVLQAGIRANPVDAATFVRFAILVPVALQLVTFLARLALEALGAKTYGAVIRYATERVDSARRSSGRARIRALTVCAG